jgi:hypothetical protein
VLLAGSDDMAAEAYAAGPPAATSTLTWSRAMLLHASQCPIAWGIVRGEA